MYESERKDLVEKLSRNGITDKNVLKAMLEVERHLFVPEAIISNAYKDVALPIGYNQTISQPYTVAFMTQTLNIHPGYKILEIGTGSGYQAAILEKMGAKVYTIERHPEIFLKTQKFFDKYGIRVACRLGDGTIGWADFAPYDGIIVTAGSPTIPENLKKQLAIRGKMVIPVGDRRSQTLKVLTKISNESFSELNIPQFKFVPLIGKEGWKEK